VIDEEKESRESRESREKESPRRPIGFRLPQIVVEGILRKSKRADIITFKLRLLRLIELTFIVTIPEEGKVRAPVYIRMFVDRSQEDPPGSVVIE